MNLLRNLLWCLIGFALWVFPYTACAVSTMEARVQEQVLESETITGLLADRLQTLVNDPRKRIEIKDLHGIDPVTLPAGVLTHEVILPEQAYRGGPLAATLVFLVNGQEKKRLRISARIDLYADVVVARHYLKRHQEIQEKDVQMVQRNVALLPNDVAMAVEDVLDRRTTLSVNGQEVLRKSMVEIPPLVKRGDRVIMTIENRRFRITAWGEVKDEGRKGERIKLVNLSSKKEVYGKVLDANTVQIEY